MLQWCESCPSLSFYGCYSRFLNILEKHKSKQLQIERNISLSDDFVSELHRHTMIPSTPKCFMRLMTHSPTPHTTKTVNEKQCCLNRSYPSWATETVLVKFWQSQQAQSGNTVFVKPASTVWTALIQSSVLIQTPWLQLGGTESRRQERIGRKGGREGWKEEKGDFPTSHWNLFSGCSLHPPCCPFMEKWEGLIT